MALNRATRYPGRFQSVTTNNPQGAFKNRTTSTSEDGSYFEADWANDWDGFFARILNVAGVTPNGDVDTGTSSQLYDALMNAMPGRLQGSPIVFSESGTYTPTDGTKFIRVKAIAAGGGSAGCPATSSSTTGGCPGGFYGQYIDVIIPVSSLSATTTITIGAPGTAGTGASGVGGGTAGDLVFGSIFTLSGGTGGGAPTIGTGGLVSGTHYISGRPLSSTITPINSSAGVTKAPQFIQVTAGIATGHTSYPSPFEGGYYGSGAEGVYSGASASRTVGFAGRPGRVVIEEYS